MNVTLPLARMSVAEKLRTMETLWDDLSRNGEVASPDWHHEVLEKREKRLRAGEERPIAWETARKRLQHRRS